MNRVGGLADTTGKAVIGNSDAAAEAYESVVDLTRGARLAQSVAGARLGCAESHVPEATSDARKFAAESLVEFESLGHCRSAEVAMRLEAHR